MSSCLIIGDSLAVGVAMHTPQCAVQAAVGRRTQMAAGLHYPSADTVLISLGSNDFVDVERELLSLRSSIAASQVVWLLPPRNQRAAVARIAARYGDRIIDAQPFVSGQGVHPSSDGYRRIARIFRAR